MNQAYPKGFQALGSSALLGTQIDLLNDTIKVICVKGTYTFSTSHQYLSDLSSNTVGSGYALSSKTDASGVLRAASTVISAVPSGADVTALVIYKDTGTPSTSPLIGYLDTASGLPFTPTGADVTVVWDPGLYGIFQI